MNDIKIRKATSLNDLRRVYHLVNEVYNHSGIANKSSDGLMIHHPGQDVVPQSHIFMAEKEDHLVGTITLTIDNQFGLMVDDDFKDSIQYFRKRYAQLSTVWRFAVVKELQNDIRIMKKLICAALLHLRWYEIPICLISISPKHVRFYKHLIKMEEVTYGKDSNKLIKKEHADVVLMKVLTKDIPQRWFEYHGNDVMI